MTGGSDLAARFNALLREEVRAKWEQSGRPFGRAEPPSPSASVKYRAETGERGVLAVTTEPYPELEWYFPWDGSDHQLLDWIETVAEDYWCEYVDRNYSSRRNDK